MVNWNIADISPDYAVIIDDSAWTGDPLAVERALDSLKPESVMSPNGTTAHQWCEDHNTQWSELEHEFDAEIFEELFEDVPYVLISFMEDGSTAVSIHRTENETAGELNE